MATVLQSCRIDESLAPLPARQARRKKLEGSTLGSLDLQEQAREEEYPGVGFRDGARGPVPATEPPGSVVRSPW